jgi:hypothetical protein
VGGTNGNALGLHQLIIGNKNPPSFSSQAQNKVVLSWSVAHHNIFIAYYPYTVVLRIV